MFLVLSGLFSCSPDQKENMRLPMYLVDSLTLRNENGTLYDGENPFTGNVYALSSSNDTIFSLDYVGGKEHGTHKAWYNTHTLHYIRFYENGKKTGKHIGFWENGRKKYAYYFENDLYEGTQYEWHANGKPYTTRNFLEGYESGIQQMWDENGNIKANYEARNGRNYGNIGKKNCASLWSNATFSKPN